MRLTRRLASVDARSGAGRARGVRARQRTPIRCPRAPSTSCRRAAASSPTTRPRPSSSTPPTSRGCRRRELRWTGCGCPDERGQGRLRRGAGVRARRSSSACPPRCASISCRAAVGRTRHVAGIGLPLRRLPVRVAHVGRSPRKLGEHASFGMSLDHSYSQQRVPRLAQRRSPRPCRTGPTRTSASPPSRATSTARARSLPRSARHARSPSLDGQYTFGMALRPTGRRGFELGVEVQYWQGLGPVEPAGHRGLDVPGFGRAFGASRSPTCGNDTHRGVVGTAGLELHWGGLSAGGGALFGSGLGSSSTRRRVRHGRHRGLHAAGHPDAVSHAVWIRIESTPGAREHVALLRKLWKLADDARRRRGDARPAVRAGRLVRARRGAGRRAPRAARPPQEGALLARGRGLARRSTCARTPTASSSTRRAASATRASGRSTSTSRACSTSSASRRTSSASAPHKTRARAVHQRARRRRSPPPTTRTCCASIEAVFVRNLSLYRHMTEERIREVTAPRAVRRAGGARTPASSTASRSTTSSSARPRSSSASDVALRRSTRTETKAPAHVRQSRARSRILYLEGDIVDGRSQHIPLIDMRLLGSYSMADTIKQLREDPTVRAVVLRIESPGGSSMASDVMWRELHAARREAKPLIVSMGVGRGERRLLRRERRARTSTPCRSRVTGSIGVFYGKADLSGLLGKLGVTIDTYKTAPRADAESLFRRLHARRDARSSSTRSTSSTTRSSTACQQGRGMTKADDRRRRARARVDGAAGARAPPRRPPRRPPRGARPTRAPPAHLPDDAPIVEYPPRTQSLLEHAARSRRPGRRPRAGAARRAAPADQGRRARAGADAGLRRSDEPLARIEWVEVPDGQ